MKAVIQRVEKASVSAGGEVKGKTGKGLLVLLAVHKDDELKKAFKMAEKVVNLRIFPDDSGKMNLSLLDAGGSVLVVSQFTLYGDCRKGNRPAFTEAAGRDKAIPIYEKFVSYLREREVAVETGVFGEDMSVFLVNNGPVTIIIDI